MRGRVLAWLSPEAASPPAQPGCQQSPVAVGTPHVPIAVAAAPGELPWIPPAHLGPRGAAGVKPDPLPAGAWPAPGMLWPRSRNPALGVCLLLRPRGLVLL